MSSFPDRFQRVRARAAAVLPTGLSVVASTASVGWVSVSGCILEGHLAESFHWAPVEHVVVFHLRHTAQVELKRAGRLTRFYSNPGSVTIVPAALDYDVRTDRRAAVLCWLISPRQLADLAAEGWNSTRPMPEVVEALNIRDAELWGLGEKLAALLRAPIAGSCLYAQALSVQVAVQLLWNHSTLRDVTTKAELLDDLRLRRVVEYIHSSLGEEITLDGLSNVAGLSTTYFLGAFKRALGKTPHRYLTEQRVAKACELLHNPHRSIVGVALDVGFSSQSHLTAVFRRFMKTTPAAYRQDVLGLRGASVETDD